MQPFASLRLFQPLRRLLAEKPALLASIQQQYGLTFTVSDLDAKLSGEQMENLFAELAKEGFPFIAFDLANEIEIGTFGVFDFYLHACDTLGQALTEFHRFHAIVFQDLPSMEIRLEQEGLAITLCERYADGRLMNMHRANLIYGVFHAMMCLLIGDSELRPIFVDSNYPPLKPEFEALVSKWFGNHVRYNCEKPRIVYEGSLWNFRLRNANPRLRTVLLPEIKTEWTKCSASQSLQQQIMDAINSTGLTDATIDRIASFIDLPVSTLKRKLKQKNLTFSDILTTTKQHHAIETLSNSDEKIEIVALKCGFSERTSFERAFRQWYGISTAKFREDTKNLQKIKSLVKIRLDTLPSLANLHNERLKIACAENATPDDFMAAVAHDPILVATLLSLANSPLTGAGQVTSIYDAIHRHLKPESVRQILLGVTATSELSPHISENYDISFWVRSFALIAMFEWLRPHIEWLNRITTTQLSSIAALRNIALLFVNQSLPLKIVDIRENDSFGSIFTEERETWGFSRYQLGFYILSQWGIPTDIALCVRAFDDSEMASSPDVELQRLLNLLNAFIEFWYAEYVAPKAVATWQNEMVEITQLSHDDVQQLAILAVGNFVKLENQAALLLQSG